MSSPGAKNAITDVQGLLVGHYSDAQAASGVTVVICPEGAVAGVDVRGSAPGTRETDLMDPSNLVEKAQAVVLTGGSVYGLATVDGVVTWLREKGWGFPLENGQVAPIVPAAALFDLGRGVEEYIPPIGPPWGRLACEAASRGAPALGSAGAGTGALAGGIKGGLGTASEVLASGLTVAALVAVNSLGSVLDPASGLFWEARLELNNELGPAGRRPVTLPAPQEPRAAGNTTIGLVATDAKLSKSQARKLAQMAHDGLARAIRPAHTMFDGDTIFCLATGQRDLPDTPGFFAAPQAQAINELGRAAADCFCRAVMRGVAAAESLGGMTALRDLPDR
ncbi:peptidase S58 [Desulfocarbo indianensis]|nr:peptidase S58 [Desulfocarbo indianensis]